MESNDNLIKVGLAALAFISGLLLEKYKSRITKLKYKLSYYMVGKTQEDKYWGDVEVRHMGRTIRHLTFITLKITNEGSKDLTDMILRVWVDRDSRILGNDANYVEDKAFINLEEKYKEGFEKIIAENEIEIEIAKSDINHVSSADFLHRVDWHLMNKAYIVPVFNRNTSINVNMMVENIMGKDPIVTPSVTHQSVRLIEKEEFDKSQYKQNLFVTIAGMIFFALSFLGYFFYFQTSFFALIVIGIIGVAHVFIGVFIYRLYKYLSKVFI